MTKILDPNTFCFILCSNNKTYLEECLYYISLLHVPEGYCVDIISIPDATSMTSGYNEAMAASNAKYKIYLHQDVFILYSDFLQAILDIFQYDSTIGMIGMVGTVNLPCGAVMWFGPREGQLYGLHQPAYEYTSYHYHLSEGLHVAEAIDGLMMITSVDLPWREDKFDGWDFYDISQSLEFRKAGYKIVVPEQSNPWCMHDDEILNLARYNHYRKICIMEYPEVFLPKIKG